MHEPVEDGGGPEGARPLLEVSDLQVDFTTMHGAVRAVEGVSLAVTPGRTLAIVGESGSGKSTTAMAAIGLLPGNGRVTGGSIRFDGQELVGLPESRMRSLRGRQVGLVPQDPMSNLNPVSRIGTQVAETLLTHRLATRRDVDGAVAEVMRRAGIPEPERRAGQYPHELSGGLRQRALIAIALACRPQLLIADEPTSALDVSVQATVLKLFRDLQEEYGFACLFISHDLAVVEMVASRIAVMRHGHLLEIGPSSDLVAQPRHPYTQRLLAAVPVPDPVEQRRRREARDALIDATDGSLMG